MDLTSIHIQFADGSNPYVRYNMTAKEFAVEKAKWERRFTLVDQGTDDKYAKGIRFFKAYEKERK